MSKSLKIILFAIAGLLGLLILTAVVLIFFVDASVYKPRLERATSEALGMEVHVDGRVRIAFFPGLQIRFDDVRVRNREMDVVSAKKASLEIALLPLLHKEVLIRKIGLTSPTIAIQRDRDGVFNFEIREEAKRIFPGLVLNNLSLADGVFLYKDEQSGGVFEARKFNLNMTGFSLAEGNSGERLKKLSFTAEFTCPEIRTTNLLLSNVKVTCKGKDGIFALNPITMSLFGGHGAGSIGADFTGSIPSYSVRSSLSKFRIEEYFQTISSKKVAEGAMDFSASLSLRGHTVKEIKQSAGGEVFLRGENILLYGNDLDREFARYESSQNFNLVDVGAFFFAGPLGLAVTKGYGFASIFQGAGGTSVIGKLFSDWKVEHGIAQARDVAMATRHNRIALQGRVDFVDERFDNVTIALIDARGCARVKQKITGPFRKPVVEKPNVLMSLVGPVVNLLKQAKRLFPGGKCKAFYTGSVQAPE